MGGLDLVVGGVTRKISEVGGLSSTPPAIPTLIINGVGVIKNPQNDLKIMKIPSLLPKICAGSVRGASRDLNAPQRGVEGSENLNPAIFG